MSVFAYAAALATGAASTTGTTTTLRSTTSTWTANQWLGETVRLDDGAQSGTSRLIASNTTDTLTFGALSAAPGSSAGFRIARTLTAEAGGVSASVVEIGDRHRAMDGTYRTSIINRVIEYRLRTTPLAFADASSVAGTLQASTQPVACGGDMLSSASLVSCRTEVAARTPVLTADGVRREQLDVMLYESS